MGKITIEDIEAIQKRTGLNDDQLSIKLGMSSRAIYQTKQRGKVSKWVALEISLRFGKILSEVRR